MGQWLEHPSGITVVLGSIPTWNSEIFSLVSSPVGNSGTLIGQFRSRDLNAAISLLEICACIILVKFSLIACKQKKFVLKKRRRFHQSN